MTVSPARAPLCLQLRGHAEPNLQPPLGGLPELPSARGAGDARHAARLVALEAWLAAVLDAIRYSRLTSHPPLAKLLALHTPFVVRLQARARTHLAQRRYAAARGEAVGARCDEERV